MVKTPMDIVVWAAQLTDENITSKDKVNLSYLFALRYHARKTLDKAVAS